MHFANKCSIASSNQARAYYGVIGLFRLGMNGSKILAVIAARLC